MEKDLSRKIAELHELWWEIVWDEIAWDEHGNEPAEFALIIREGWDRFGRMGKILEDAGIDTQALVAEFEAKGDPSATGPEYALIAGKARRTCGS